MLVALPAQLPPQGAPVIQTLDARSTLAFGELRAHDATSTPERPDVPFYSQFKDISSAKWQKVGCGIASLAMLIDYYESNSVSSVDTLLTQGITSGAYLKNAGWTHRGLIALSKKYGLDGTSYDLARSSKTEAYEKFLGALDEGPVMASVHYKFDSKSTIPHLVVITAILGDTVYYNDPAAESGDKTISVFEFKRAWKKRFIVLRPAEHAAHAPA